MRGPGWRGLAGLDLRLATAVASAAKASFSPSATSRAIRRAVLVGGTAPSPAAAIDTFEIARALVGGDVLPIGFGCDGSSSKHCRDFVIVLVPRALMAKAGLRAERMGASRSGLVVGQRRTLSRDSHHAPSRPLTAKTGVRVPEGAPIISMA